MTTFNLGSGEPIVIPENSHFHDHTNEFVTTHLAQAFSRIRGEGRDFIEEQVSFDDCIGRAICVETTDSDLVIYAQRPKRANLSRFVQNREPEACNNLVVVLKRIDDGYKLVTAYVGYKCKEPWDRFATEEDRIFWQTHALVWGSQEVIPGTETTVCPW